MKRDRYLASRELPTTAFEHRARQLLNKQGHPAGALNHSLNRFTRKRITRGHLDYHVVHVACAQPVKRNLRMMSTQRPLRMKLGARRARQQQVRCRSLLGQQLNYF